MTNIYIHPTSIVETRQIGDGTRIWAFSHVMQGALIGRNCNIGDHCFIESGALIGDNVTIKNGNMLWEGVTLGDGVFVGPQVIFTNDLRPRSPRLPLASDRYLDRAWLLPTVVEEGVSLGAGAIVLPGLTIGQYAMLGAGAVVTRDVRPHALVLGNPARIAGWVCYCGERLALESNVGTCLRCGREFPYDGKSIAVESAVIN
ncbi:MAG TPA: acyltransferase [Terriglobales bacterium]|jgi:acetyltransferase-like isoleucine patch superfamily enzyme|nr:acyltransferase [Terriglobales bacterium]